MPKKITLTPDAAGQSAAARVELRQPKNEGPTPTAWVDVEWRDGYIQVRITRSRNDAEIKVALPGNRVVV